MTTENVDAVVNAANSLLAHGGGLAGALVTRGGRTIQDESDRLAPVPVGCAVVTSAGALPCRWVIHAVGPRWGEGDEESLLRSAIRSSLEQADHLAATSIAIPAVSTGIFGYPKAAGTAVIVDVVLQWLTRRGRTSLEQIRFTSFDRETAELFAKALSAAKSFASPG
jgi:O-acetyl-ADP-ribose deacetylase (regulator of RNase III)